MCMRGRTDGPPSLNRGGHGAQPNNTHEVHVHSDHKHLIDDFSDMHDLEMIERIKSLTDCIEIDTLHRSMLGHGKGPI